MERLEVHGQRMERCGQRGMQADGAARIMRGRGDKRMDLVAADRRANHHYRSRIETPAFDQIADRAVDAGAETVIVGAEPDAAQRGVAIHSAAVRSRSPAVASTSACFSLCSATK